MCKIKSYHWLGIVGFKWLKSGILYMLMFMIPSHCQKKKTHLCRYQSLTSMWRNFGPEVCGHWLMHSSPKEQHLSQVEV